MSDELRSVMLVIEDRHLREGMSAILRKDIGCVVLEAEPPPEALDILEKQDVCLLMTDLFGVSKAGIGLLKDVAKGYPEVVSVAGVPLGDRDAIMEALNAGAFFHIATPYDFHEALIIVAKGLHFYDLLFHKEKRGSKIRKSESFYGMVGRCRKMQDLFSVVEKVADDPDTTVLIHGESGTGKELVARAIHTHSVRKGKNFVPVNCAAIPEELLESELFGYVKGAFTGAAQFKIGRIEYADGGTLFLDEIGDMKPSLQAKLLRVLQEREFEPVGGVKPVSVDIRVVAATHRDLEEAVAEGRFREDLYYRLSVVPINIPPLRERQEDISLLLETFLKVYNRRKKLPLQGFDRTSMECLFSYAWPGNVRELENMVQHMTVLHGGKTVSLAELPDKFSSHVDSIQLAEAVESPLPEVECGVASEGVDFNDLVGQFEERLILQALETSGGNKKEAAQLLQLKRTTLTEKIKKRNIEWSRD